MMEVSSKLTYVVVQCHRTKILLLLFFFVIMLLVLVFSVQYNIIIVFTNPQ